MATVRTQIRVLVPFVVVVVVLLSPPTKAVGDLHQELTKKA
jgi:hypothetical protein